MFGWGSERGYLASNTAAGIKDIRRRKDAPAEAVILREMGYDDRAIADALGQSDPKMALHYAKGADLRNKMRGVVDQFDVELDKRRTKTVNPED